MNIRKLFSSFWIHSIFFTLLNRSSAFIFGALSYMILAKKIFPSAEDMGVWALFQSIFSASSTLKISLLRNPMIKFLAGAKSEEEKNAIQSATLIANIIFSLLVGLFIFIFGNMFCHWLNSPRLLPLCYWGLLLVLVLIPFDHCEILLQAHFQFGKVFSGYLIKQSVFLIGIISLHFFLKRQMSLSTLVQIQLVALLLALMLFIRSARPFFQQGFIFYRKITMEMFHYAKYTFGSNVFSIIARTSDSFLTANRILSDAVVGYYNVAYRVTNLIDMPSLAIADVLFPKSVVDLALDGKQRVKYNFERMMGLILSFIIPVSLVIILFAGFLVTHIASDKFLPAVPVLQVMMLFAFTRPFFFLFGVTMDAIGKPNLNFWVFIIYTPFHLWIVSESLRIFGWMGSLYGSVSSSACVFVVLCLILKRTINMSFRSIFRYILVAYRDIYVFVQKIFKKQSLA